MAEEALQDDDGADGGDGAGGKTNKKRIVLLGGILAFVVLGLGGGAFFFLAGGEDPAALVDGSEAGSEDAGEGGEEKPEAGEGKEAAAEGEKKEGETAATDKAAAPEEEQKSEHDIGFGETFRLKPFHLNLGNPLENRYVRLEISLEYLGGTETKNELERRKPQLRDVVLSIVSRKSREFLLAPDGKEHLRKQIFTQINQYMHHPIKQVFITDILIE